MVKCKNGYMACEQPITPVPAGCPDHINTRARKNSKKATTAVRGLRTDGDDDAMSLTAEADFDTVDDSMAASLLPAHGHGSAAGSGRSSSRSMLLLQGKPSYGSAAEAESRTTGRAMLQTTTGCTNNGGLNSVFSAYGPQVKDLTS